MKLRPRGPTMMNTIVQTLELIMRDGAAKKLFPPARAPAYARVLHGAIKGLALWRISEGRPLAGDADLIARYRRIARSLGDHERGQAEKALDRFAS